MRKNWEVQIYFIKQNIVLTYKVQKRLQMYRNDAKRCRGYTDSDTIVN